MSNNSPNSDDVETIIIGLSGPSSSGKTTLARLLRRIFNVSTTTGSGTKSTEESGIEVSLFIVHEDDFYKTDVDIPYRIWKSPTAETADGIRKEQDWDCVESLDLPLLARVLEHVKSTSVLPSDFASKEDQNSVGETGITDDEIEKLGNEVKSWLVDLNASSRAEHEGETRKVRICIFEGFLLFPPSKAYISQHLDRFERETSVDQLHQLSEVFDSVLDARIFLPCTRDLTVFRRARRSGYVTLEGFWADPPGYVEELVWPNYKRDHGWLFGSDEDVDAGRVDEARAQERDVAVGPGKGDVGIKIVLAWGVSFLKNVLEKKLVQHRDVL